MKLMDMNASLPDSVCPADFHHELIARIKHKERLYFQRCQQEQVGSFLSSSCHIQTCPASLSPYGETAIQSHRYTCVCGLQLISVNSEGVFSFAANSLYLVRVRACGFCKCNTEELQLWQQRLLLRRETVKDIFFLVT